jgi:hypothetical protein
MSHRYFVKDTEGSFEEQSNLNVAQDSVKSTLANGYWAYIEIYLDVGLQTGAGLMKYECIDQKEAVWVRKDQEPIGPGDC